MVASSFSSSSLTFFRRDPELWRVDAALRDSGVHHRPRARTCRRLPGLGSGGQVAIDRGGLFVYAAAVNNGMLATIVRDFAPVCQSSSVDVAFNTTSRCP